MFVKSVSIGLALMLLFAWLALAEVGISNLKPEKYKVSAINVGEIYYVDRTFTIISLPEELKEAQLIMTGNDDKKSLGPGFITFDINQPATIYIGHDSRGEEAKGGVPTEWLSKDFKFVDGLAIEVSDTNMGTFGIWKKDYKAGSISLGGNADPPAAGQGSMYIVLVMSSELSNPSSVESSGKLVITWAGIKEQSR